jgi:hypothetical protein
MYKAMKVEGFDIILARLLHSFKHPQQIVKPLSIKPSYLPNHHMLDIPNSIKGMV